MERYFVGGFSDFQNRNHPIFTTEGVADAGENVADENAETINWSASNG